MIQNCKTEIVNSFIRTYDAYRLSNAYAENINGKIRAYLAISNGTTNFERLRRKIIFSFNNEIFYAITNNVKSLKRQLPNRGAY